MNLDQEMAAWRRELKVQDRHDEMIGALRGTPTLPEQTERRETTLLSTPFVPLAQDEVPPVSLADTTLPCCLYPWPPYDTRAGEGEAESNDYTTTDIPGSVNYNGDVLNQVTGAYEYVGQHYRIIAGTSMWELYDLATGALIQQNICLTRGGVTVTLNDTYTITFLGQTDHRPNTQQESQLVTRVSNCVWKGTDSQGRVWSMIYGGNSDAGSEQAGYPYSWTVNGYITYLPQSGDDPSYAAYVAETQNGIKNGSRTAGIMEPNGTPTGNYSGAGPGVASPPSGPGPQQVDQSLIAYVA